MAAFELRFLSTDITSFKSLLINFIIELSISLDEISGELACKLATNVAFFPNFFSISSKACLITYILNTSSFYKLFGILIIPA